MFVPGGLIGLIGGVLIAIGVYLSFKEYGTANGMIVLCFCLVAIVIVAIITFKILPKTSMGNMLFLKAEVSKETGYHSDSYVDDNLVGKEGFSESELRPSGIAMIDNTRIDVVTEGEFVPPRTRIKVLRVDGNRVVVETL
jgi:membrane-bound serine protease (ClpP class)